MPRILLLGVVLFAVGALVVLLVGPMASGPDGGLERAGEPAGGAPPGDRTGASGAAEEGGGRTGSAGPILFGRPVAERVGRGGLQGRIALVSEAERPLVGAHVVLEGTGHGGEAVLRRVDSGDDGAFAFPDVPAGADYLLGIEAEGLPGRTRGGITVRDGNVTDLGTVWLGEKAPLIGYVHGPDGAGVSGARVQVHEGHVSMANLVRDFSELFARLEEEPEPVARVTSARDGSFRLDALDPGPVTVIARAPGFGVGMLEAVVVSTDGDQADWVVELGEGRVLVGTVEDPEGRGISGARVAAMAEGTIGGLVLGRHYVETDAGGAFRIDTVPAGQDLQLLVSARGHGLSMVRVSAGEDALRVVLHPSVPLEIQVVVAPDDAPLAEAQLFAVSEPGGGGSQAQVLVGRTDANGMARFDAAPGELGMVMISHAEQPTGMWNARAPAQFPGMLEGPEDAAIGPGPTAFRFRVHAGRVVTGRVTAEDGAPIAGAEVEPFGGFTFGRPSLTDADGRYRVVVGRRAGMGLMVVRAHGFVVLTVQVSAASDDASEVVKDVSLVRAAVVRGRVVDEGGRPVAGVQVKPLGSSGVSGMGMGGTFLEAAPSITGPSGHYVLTSFPPGDEARVVARRAGYLVAGSPPMKIVPGGSVRAADIVLGGGETIVVEVTDPEGRAIEDALVEVDYAPEGGLEWSRWEAWQGDDRGRTDATGRARFAGVPNGKATLTASHEAWAAGRTVVEIDEETRSPVRATVVLRPSRRVAGRVLDASGQPIVGARLSVQDAAGGWVNAASGEDGRFLLDGVPAEAARLSVGAEGFRNRTVDLHGGDGRDLEIRLEAISAGDQARIAELQARMMELSVAFQEAKSDAERQGLQQELMQVSSELQRLQSGRDGD